MHEMSLMDPLIHAALHSAEDHGAKRITAMRLRVGKRYQTTPEALQLSYEMCTGGTIAEGCQFLFEEIPVSGECRACGGQVESEDVLLMCPVCGSVDVAVLHGDELELVDIEIET